MLKSQIRGGYMRKEHLVLDFNDNNLKFNLSKVANYDINTIFNNIDKFKLFVNDSVISHTFDKVFKSSVFQVALYDESSAYIDNLLLVYNAIASGNLIENLQVPQITEKELVKQLRARGFKVFRTRISMGNGTYENTKKVKKEDELTWN